MSSSLHLALGGRSSASGRKERRRKWWAKCSKKNNTRPVSVDSNKPERGKHVGVEGGKERGVKKTPVSSNPAGFRSSQHTLGPATVPLNPPLSNVEELDPESSLSTETDVTTLNTQDIKSSTASKESSTELTSEHTTSAQPKRRYIAFIGNLPFDATGDNIIQHFHKIGVHISQVRLLTDKASGDSKGCCFAEFPNAKTLQNALKFHHTKMCSRRLNIEVTCGGGGRSHSRMKKIRAKNENLRKTVKPVKIKTQTA